MYNNKIFYNYKKLTNNLMKYLVLNKIMYNNKLH